MVGICSGYRIKLVEARAQVADYTEIFVHVRGDFTPDNLVGAIAAYEAALDVTNRIFERLTEEDQERKNDGRF